MNIPPEIFNRVLPFYEKIMQAPFPAPHIITDMVSREFPEFDQASLYHFTQRIKASIADMEHLYNLVTPHISASARTSCLNLSRTLRQQSNSASHN